VTSRPIRRLLLAVAGSMALTAAACDSGGVSPPTQPPPIEIGADAYVTVITRFLPPSLNPESLPVVYVVPVSGDALSLETQVAVIETLAQGYDIRFVDQPTAALDGASDGEPPRDAGTLIGLGRIAPDPPHQVRVELYRGRDRVNGHLLTLRNEGGVWVVADAETVTPEVLVGDG
jgi:hypothetical protein